MATKIDFKSVNAALKTSDPESAEKTRARVARKVEKRIALLAVLAAGETPAHTMKTGTEQKARKLNAGATVALVVKLLRAGCLLHQVRESAPELAHRFPWELAGDAIRSVAGQAGMADTLPFLFGLRTQADLDDEAALQAELDALDARDARDALDAATTPTPASAPVVEKAARVESDPVSNRAARKAHGKKAA